MHGKDAKEADGLTEPNIKYELKDSGRKGT